MKTTKIAAEGRTIRVSGIYRLIANGNGNERGDIWIDGMIFDDGYTIEPFIHMSDVYTEDFLTYVDASDEEVRVMAAEEFA